MVIFSGRCIRCSASHTVAELEQRISCLEAKNNGAFGDCQRGVNYDQHDPGLECGPCSSILGTAVVDGDELVAATPSHHNHHHTGSGGNTASGGGGGGCSSSGGGGDVTKRRRVR